MIIPVILSGGSGLRLWPLSRELFPKQFLPLCSESTMIQETVTRLDRLRGVVVDDEFPASGFDRPLVVCNEIHRFLVAEQLRVIDRSAMKIILEPVGRNTAPAIAAAGIYASRDGCDPVLLVLPADHQIKNIKAFHAALAAGLKAAEDSRLVTFGIVPDRPETAYGYIKTSSTDSSSSLNCRPVAAFVEKPDLETAKRYLSEGNYFWNSGMFMFRASSLLAEIEKHSPEVMSSCRAAVDGSTEDADFLRLDLRSFEKSPSISIDYAVMEKTSEGVVIPLDAAWNDIGSWSALAEINVPDNRGNVIQGDGMANDADNCFIRSSGRFVAAVGVSDLIIVETADAVLVAHKDSAQSVKKIVDALKESNRIEVLNHLKVARPWGSYETIDLSERFQVKRITVKPGASLSLQKHYHRAEHWVVVSGTAQITRGDKVMIISENQSTYIPPGITHRLSNPGKIQLELIEVQSGSYLAEDDIVRLEDSYGRA